MTSHAVADILRVLSDEVSDMAQIASAFDQALGQVELQAVLSDELHQLQQVDTMQQHLQDVAVALNAIVDLIGAGPRLDLDEVTAKIQLHDLRNRLNGQKRYQPTAMDDGEVQLF